MKLESLDEIEENQRFFCRFCGRQLNAVDEIWQSICFQCKKIMKDRKAEETFYCWACGKPLLQMSEIAQGICDICKTSIIRKIQKPQKIPISSIVNQ